MKRTILALASVALFLAGCSGGGDGSDTSESATATSSAEPAAAAVDEPAETDGLSIKLTGWRIAYANSAEGDVRTVPYVVIEADVTNNGGLTSFDPVPGYYVGRGDKSETITLLYDGIEVLEAGATAPIQWAFGLPESAFKDGRLVVNDAEWSGDFTSLPKRSDIPQTTEATATATATPEVVPTYETPEPTYTPEAPPTGYTAAPTGEPTALPEKEVAYCMDDPIYQKGTTMFTDGTTGWTQQCAG